MTTDDKSAEVVMSRSTYNQMKSVFEEQTRRYGGYTDDQIDNIIDIKIACAQKAFLVKMAETTLQTNIEEMRLKSEQECIDYSNIINAHEKLREYALTEAYALPIPETDEEMEALLR